MTWRMAKSLDTLLSEINQEFPGRSKLSDGGIGDAKHATKDSDHNPWVRDGTYGVVTARDFTHDPSSGLDSENLAEALRASRDPRIKYIISNRKICSSYEQNGVPAWTWRKYTGSNPHNKHCHLSVVATKALYDDQSPWRLNIKPPKPKSATLARTTGFSLAGAGAVAQGAVAVMGPVNDTVEQVRVVTDTTGQVVATSKAVIQVAPEGFWMKVLAMFRSPEFLFVLLVLVILAWGFTYFMRNRSE